MNPIERTEIMVTEQSQQREKTFDEADYKLLKYNLKKSTRDYLSLTTLSNLLNHRILALYKSVVLKNNQVSNPFIHP